MTWDEKVKANAQKWADTCAGQTRPVRRPPHTRPDGTNSYALTPMSGENVAVGSKSPEKAVELWYNEITKPGYTPGGDGGPGVGHYTAMIWASTGKLGCAQAACPNGTPNPVIVCHYAMMAPNSGDDSEYVANVPQINTPSATEETCCQTIYGDPSAATNPHLNPVAVPTTQAPAQQGPCTGVFTDNEGKTTVQGKPWHIGSVWVYGAAGSVWFKMVSVDKDGKKIENRHSKTHLTDSMTPAQLQAAWDAANRGGEYSVKVVLGDTSAPAPAMKLFPRAGDAEGTIYTSDGDQMMGDEPKTGWRSTVSSMRRRMRGDFYAIAKTAIYTLVKSGAQCRSKNSKYYGCWVKTAGDCAKKVKKEGKKFFIYYEEDIISSKGTNLGRNVKCYAEETTSVGCPEGFLSAGFNSKYSFYNLLD